VSEDVWSEEKTSPGRVEEALRALLAKRYQSGEAVAPARVLNLVAVVDGSYRGEIENRLDRVGRYHPSRTILLAVEKGRTTLDAVVSLTADEDDRLHIAHERIEIDMGPKHLRGLETIVGPLLVRDLSTLVWAPHGHAEALHSLRQLAQIALVDTMNDDIDAALAAAADLKQDMYVVDLSWLRSTPWRERVAAAFDPPHVRPGLRSISSVTVRHRHDSTSAAALFCGWLCSRLGWRPQHLMRRGDHLVGHARAKRGEVALKLEPVQQHNAPGLAGVTIEIANGEAVSLDRAPGGLKEVRRERDGTEREFTVLGASRGESGILGEGVRQALLRDWTYGAALEDALELVAK
jgi:glucose-6-phosphate dehydrogenase assembly protein OpcA